MAMAPRQKQTQTRLWSVEENAWERGIQEPRKQLLVEYGRRNRAVESRSGRQADEVPQQGQETGDTRQIW